MSYRFGICHFSPIKRGFVSTQRTCFRSALNRCSLWWKPRCAKLKTARVIKQNVNPRWKFERRPANIPARIAAVKSTRQCKGRRLCNLLDEISTKKDETKKHCYWYSTAHVLRPFSGRTFSLERVRRHTSTPPTWRWPITARHVMQSYSQQLYITRSCRTTGRSSFWKQASFSGDNFR
jgi:hypothetical protein